MVTWTAVKEIKPFKIGSSEVLEILYTEKKKQYMHKPNILDALLNYDSSMYLVYIC